MRTLKLILIILGLMFSISMPAPTLAQNTSNASNKRVTTLRISKTAQRPRIPGQATITVTYTDNTMEFELPDDASYMEVSICNQVGAMILSGVVTLDSPILPINLYGGEYTVTCTTNNNQIFVGTIYM